MFKMQKRMLALSFILIATLVAINFYAITGLAQAQVVCAEDYVVQADDTLGGIADKVFGDVLAYPAIFEATNAAGEGYEVIGDPNVIEVGQTLCIPAADDVDALLGTSTISSDTGARVINISPARFFPEGVTVDKLGNFYIGSMDEGRIFKTAPGATEAEPFIEAGANDLVSVLGLYADDATGTLWACSSDADNAQLSGTAPVALKAFDLATGAAKGSYEFPGSGFCNDITIDAAGNVYASDSWSPRILRLPVGGDALEEWVNDAVLGVDMWSLNGLDVDQGQNVLYIVNIATGQLFSIPIAGDGSAGAITEIATSQPLQRPDGLKVVGPNTLAVAESVPGGMSLLSIDGDTATVEVVSTGLNGVATFALNQGSAWLVENQADHFWGPDDAGPDADPPFRLVEIPLNVGAGAGIVNIMPARFFPEGVTVDENGTLYVGSMDEGRIFKAAAGATEAEPFIEAGANDLVSVLGLYADDATGTLWACSSDADNAQLSGNAPVALKAFDLATGEAKGSYEFPDSGFCNDITVDAAGNVYASDSWSPRILRLPVGGDALEEWVNDPVLGVDMWSLNGLDIDQSSNTLYLVNIATGQLFSIPIADDGSAGAITEIQTSIPLRRPDGLKVLDANTLAVAESQPGGISLLTLNGNTAQVRVINTGLDGVATFALYNGSAWVVEGQADHFWGPDSAGPNANPPFRLVEVPLN